MADEERGQRDVRGAHDVGAVVGPGQRRVWGLALRPGAPPEAPIRTQRKPNVTPVSMSSEWRDVDHGWRRWWTRTTIRRSDHPLPMATTKEKRRKSGVGGVSPADGEVYPVVIVVRRIWSGTQWKGRMRRSAAHGRGWESN